MRIPRKLKKGCRTLHGSPRTRWQQKGLIHIMKTLGHIVDAACGAAIGMDLLGQAIEKIHPVSFLSGGIAPLPPNTEIMPPNTEMIITDTDYKLITQIKTKKELCKDM